jgi:hypothetical protein
MAEGDKQALGTGTEADIREEAINFKRGSSLEPNPC